jgi:phage terminase Nu1 subunit (DNA packaging protein)
MAYFRTVEREAQVSRIDQLLSLDTDPDMVDAAEVADWLGLTSNRVNALSREGVLPRINQRFDLKPTVQAYAEHCRNGVTRQRGDPDLAAAKLALTEANALKVELQNAKANGDLLDAANVRAEWLGFATDLRARLLSIPSRVAARLCLDRAASAALDAELRRAMEDLSESQNAE